MLVRETVWAGLFTKLAAIPGFKTKERKLRHWDGVPKTQMPYLAVIQTHEVPSYDTGRTTQYMMYGAIYVYASGPVPATVLNPLIDGVTAAFAFDNTMDNAFTVGGLVMWCRMGTHETDEGTLGDLSVVRIPVEMLAFG